MKQKKINLLSYIARSREHLYMEIRRGEGGSAAQEAVRRRQRGSEIESGEEATAQLGGRRAAWSAERRRLRGYEGRRGGSAVT